MTEQVRNCAQGDQDLCVSPWEESVPLVDALPLNSGAQVQLEENLGSGTRETPLSELLMGRVPGRHSWREGLRISQRPHDAGRPRQPSLASTDSDFVELRTAPGTLGKSHLHRHPGYDAIS